ncbi:hypothetical protein [Tenggerimyces flavus]|uniref:PIN domain-containing protein n=1 Tax=Tenggerimyces flavus TaxID=1708749 RepID=A0ABV7Y5T4_9ACTN|nr:hypothetical protein [Tenggerimyces flavus]MBM7790530.1 hypothetical protein [Tenggerimyces flavus]
MRIQDAELGTTTADAHLAACIQQTAGPHAVLTSDADDLARIAAYLNVDVRIVAV